MLAKKHGEGSFPAKESSETTHTSALNAGYFHSSTFSTPTKTSYGLQAPSQTPSSKLTFVSASGHNKQQPVGAGQKVGEVAVITRTPLRLLPANSRNASLFSPSPLDRLGSPALQGKARRVFVMPPELLSTPRRVPVKQKSSNAINAVWQSPYLTPKKPPFATPISNKALEAACQKDDRHHINALQHREDVLELPRRVLSCTRQRTPLSTSSRAGLLVNATCQKPDAKVESSGLPKRMLAFTPRQSPCAAPISSRKDTSALTKDGLASCGVAKQHDATGLRDDDMRLDRLALLTKVLASTPARRVPIQQKQKEPSKKISSRCDEKKPSKVVASSETPKANRTCQTKVGTFGKTRPKSTSKAKHQSGDGVDEINVGDSKQQNPREGGKCEAKQQCGDGVDEIVVCESKQHDAREEGRDIAKQDGGDGVDEMIVGESKQQDECEQGTDKAKQQCGDGVDEVCVDDSGGTDHTEQQCDDVIHEISVGDSKQHNGSAKYTDNLNATRNVNHRCAIKDACSAKVKHCNETKPSRKMSSSLAPIGEVDVDECKEKSSKKMSISITSIGSTNGKECKEKKPRKKVSSLEAPKGCKVGQARAQTCRSHGKTVGGKKKGTDKAK